MVQAVHPARFEAENSLVTWKNLLLHAQAGYQLCRVCSSMRRMNCVSNRAAHGQTRRAFKCSKLLLAQAGYQLCMVCSSMTQINCVSNCAAYVQFHPYFKLVWSPMTLQYPDVFSNRRRPSIDYVRHWVPMVLQYPDVFSNRR